MPTILAESEINRYRRDGILFPLNVLSPDEAARNLAEANKLEAAIGENPKTTELSQMHLHFRWAYDLITKPAILDAVESVIGPNMVVWSTGLFSKRPHNPAYVSWHQDGTYWNLDSTNVTTAWIALSNSTVENGCMRVVPGSQNMNYQQHRDTFAANNALSRGQEIQVDVNEDEAVDVVLAAGEMSLHHIKIIHGSEASRSDEKRVGFVARYVTPQASQLGTRPSAVLARGVDEYNHFELVGPPPQRSYDEAVAAMKESAHRQLNALLDE